jgi:hypothetical protein
MVIKCECDCCCKNDEKYTVFTDSKICIMDQNIIHDEFKKSYLLINKTKHKIVRCCDICNKHEILDEKATDIIMNEFFSFQKK